MRVETPCILRRNFDNLLAAAKMNCYFCVAAKSPISGVKTLVVTPDKLTIFTPDICQTNTKLNIRFKTKLERYQPYSTFQGHTIY